MKTEVWYDAAFDELIVWNPASTLMELTFASGLCRDFEEQIKNEFSDQIIYLGEL